MPSGIVSRGLEGDAYTITAAELKWRPATYGIVVRDGSILLSKQLGGYHLPGGGINLGETPEAAVVREIKEETGIDTRAGSLAGLLTNFFSYLDDDSRRQHVQSLQAFYVCDPVGGSLSTAGFDEWEREFAEIAEWMPLESLNDINVGSTYDWRPVVFAALKRSAA